LGGLELALSCDIIVAGADAQIADGHLAYDAMPGSGGTRRLPARTGYSGALRFLLEAPTLDGETARRWGIVDEVAPAGGALPRGEEIARTIAARAPPLVHAIKASLRAASPPATDRSYLDAFRQVVIERLVPAS
ncbi:MAG: enoyl-CoA hydratase/isomerase family protein, partial [Pseudomonadota bacterium]